MQGPDLPDDPEALREIVTTTAVFGRITPEQKRALVQAMTAAFEEPRVAKQRGGSAGGGAMTGITGGGSAGGRRGGDSAGGHSGGGSSDGRRTSAEATYTMDANEMEGSRAPRIGVGGESPEDDVPNP